MSAEEALAQVRAIAGGINAHTVQLAAMLLDAVESARDLLAPLADEETAAGLLAGTVHQLLADAATAAAPPSTAPAGTSDVPASRNGGAALLAGALALKP